MFDPKILDDIAKNLANAVPSGVLDIKADLEKNLRAGLQSALAKLDLVTREEFDVQTSVLARTRAKVDELERKLAALEAALAAGDERD